jgi:hypothetical protein
MKALTIKRWNRAMIAAMGCLALAVGGLGAVTAMAQEADAPPRAGKPVELKAEFDWATLNAQALDEYARPIRPGVPGTSPFWGASRKSFKYAPAFDFQPVEGAKYYRFTITQWDKDGTSRIGDKAWSFEAAEPWAPLTPVWTALPVSEEGTRLRLTVEGLDEKRGKAIGASKCAPVDEALAGRLPDGYVGEHYRDFMKGQPFAGPFYENEFSLHEGALRALRRTLDTAPMWGFYREHRLPIEGDRGPEYAKYASLSEEWLFAHGWLVARSMASLAKETQDRDEAALALKTAKNGAETVINTSFPADWKRAFCPSTLKSLGPDWSKYLAGEITYEQFYEDACNRVSDYRMEWEARANDPGQMFLDMYDVTKEEKYLLAAKRLAQTYRDTQLPCGTWYDGVNPKTGEPTNDALHPPALIILFLDRLASQYGILDYKETADRAFRWLLENRVKPFHFPAKFWDVSATKTNTPYLSEGSLAAAHVAICLLNRADQDPQYVAMAEEIVRFIEDQFVLWKDGKGYVSEQYFFMTHVGVSGGGATEAFWKAFEATGQPLYLAKALALANTVMAPGDYGTNWNTAPCAGIDVLEFCAFLKKHGLPGAE